MKRKLNRICTNIAAFILLLIISIVSFDCIESPLEPVAPTYDTQLNVPVLDTTNYFEEFPQKDLLFQFNVIDNTYSYRIPSVAEQKVAVGEFSAKGLSNSFKKNSVIDGAISYEFTNRIPVAMSFQLRFLKWNSAEAHSDTLIRNLHRILLSKHRSGCKWTRNQSEDFEHCSHSYRSAG